MATFAIGDVHGNFPALDDLLRQVREAATGADTVVFLGDYIDRGPRARECIDAILAFRRECDAEVVCLRGNHEDWLLRTRDDYQRHSWLLAMGALDTIRSYSADAACAIAEAASRSRDALYAERAALPYELFFDAMPAEHLHFFGSLRPYHRTADGFCSHGGVDPDVRNLEDQPRRTLIWGASGFPAGYAGDELILYGHWNNAVLTADGWPLPRTVGRTIGVDTIAFGVLTAVRAPDGEVIQSARYESYRD